MPKSETKQNNESWLSGFTNASLPMLGISLVVIVLVVFIGMFGPLRDGGGNLSKWYHPGPATIIKRPHFSADGSKFALTVCGPCKIGIYTIDSESVVYLTPPKDSVAFDATFDTRSDTIAFILARQVGDGAYDYQLAVSQIDGSRLKVLTSSDTQKRFPAYSFDGKKVVFEGKERCTGTPAKYCGADIYEYDFQSNKEKRISNLQALQIGPAYFLPGNRKIVTPIIGSLHPEGLAAVPVESKYGSERDVFIVDASKATQYEQLALDTPTASSPKPLSSGEIAFTSRVNEYENVKGSYIYDVFLWSNGTSRRLTKANRFIWDYAIFDSGQSVLLVTEAKKYASKCELILWQVADNSSRILRCEASAQELPLVP
jgi:Tol biopolymer transport system component